MDQVGVDSPWLTALVLLEHATGMDRAEVLAHPEVAPPVGRVAEYQRMVERRVAREPLAYIVGFREFYGRRFAVGPATLIPRPETEAIIDFALHRMARREAEGARHEEGGLRLLDVGTGSGAIALTLLLQKSQWVAIATDTDQAALRVAHRNAVDHGVERRLGLVVCHLASAVRGPFGLIVANLPYIPSAQLDGLEPEVARYEPRHALDAGPDGTSVIGAFLQAIPELLAPGGSALLEVGDGQASGLMERAREILPGCAITVERDATGAHRFLAIDRHEA